MSASPSIIEAFDVTWSGIALRISFERNFLGMDSTHFPSAHLQIESLTPVHTPADQRDRLPLAFHVA